MSLTVLQGFERRLDDGGVGPEIGVAHLQADDIPPAGFEREDAVCHGNGGGLSDEVKLLVEVWHGLSFGRLVQRFATRSETGVSVSNKQKSRQRADGIQVWLYRSQKTLTRMPRIKRIARKIRGICTLRVIRVKSKP
jgi:hypothetical protein